MSVFFLLATFVVVIVYLTCEFIIGLAFRHKQTLLTSTCDGTVVTQHDFFTASFYFYCVMTQSEAHNVHQAWWPDMCVYVCVCVKERERDTG